MRAPSQQKTASPAGRGADAIDERATRDEVAAWLNRRCAETGDVFWRNAGEELLSDRRPYHRVDPELVEEVLNLAASGKGVYSAASLVAQKGAARTLRELDALTNGLYRAARREKRLASANMQDDRPCTPVSSGSKRENRK